MADLSPKPAVSLESVAKMIEVAIGNAAALLARVGRTADHLGGSIPRGVGNEKDAETSPGGMVPSLVARLQRLHDTLNMTSDELGRIETFTATSDGAIRVGIGGAGGGLGAAATATSSWRG